MPKNPLTLGQKVEVVESLIYRRQVLETDRNLKLAEFRKKIDAEMEEIRRRLTQEGDTTGDRIRDYVLLHRGIDYKEEEWCRQAEARLRGHGGQLVMTSLTRMQSHGPFVRHMYEGGGGDGKRHIADMGSFRQLVKYYQLAVLTGEELNLEGHYPRLPTGPHLVWSVKENSFGSPLLAHGLTEALLPLPRPVSERQHLSRLSSQVPTIFDDEGSDVESSLFVGDDEVGEEFKKNNWPEEFWVFCALKMGRHELVPPDLNPA